MAFSFFKKIVDPICKMEVKKDTPFKSEYGGNTYHFCALNCKQTFDKNPGRYAK